MKLVNYFGKEFERENPLTDKDLKNKKDMMVIYLAMGCKKDIDDILQTLTSEEAKLIGVSAQREYIRESMRYL